MTEIAPDVFRFCLYAPGFGLQFNFFLVRDEQPLLFTTGYRSGFPVLREAVARVIDPARIGGRVQPLRVRRVRRPEPVARRRAARRACCGLVAAVVNVTDFAIRPPRGMADGETLDTGKYRFRYCPTAQLPHGWDAGLLFEETQRTLFCSDLFHQDGEVESLTDADLSDRVRAAMTRMQAGPLANYIPYTARTDGILQGLADLKPRTLAIMHGSSFAGDGEHRTARVGRHDA